jgi:hypothetical protein
MTDDKQQQLAQELNTAAIAAELAQTERSQLDIDPKPFAALLSNDADLVAVFEHLERAIFRSFAVDIQREPFGPLAQRGVTREELKRRFRFCEAWFRRARGDLGMSLEKTLDLMGHALRCAIDGREFDPNATQTQLWSPT